MNREDDLTSWEKDVPLLASLKREDGFTVPENYFKNLLRFRSPAYRTKLRSLGHEKKLILCLY